MSGLLQGKGEVDCNRKVCEEKVCDVGSEPQTVSGSQDSCCPLQVLYGPYIVSKRNFRSRTRGFVISVFDDFGHNICDRHVSFVKKKINLKNSLLFHHNKNKICFHPKIVHRVANFSTCKTNEMKLITCTSNSKLQICLFIKITLF